MKKLGPQDLLDIAAYEKVREERLDAVIALKKHRRVAVGDPPPGLVRRYPADAGGPAGHEWKPWCHNPTARHGPRRADCWPGCTAKR